MALPRVYANDEITAFRWPKPNDYAAIHKEQLRRMAVARGDAYTRYDCERFYLFVGVDAQGNETHRTRRVSTMLQFLVGVSAAALSGTCALNVAPSAFERSPDPENPRLMVPSPEEVDTLAAGNAIWLRSCVEERIEEWAASASEVGDLFIEVGWSEEDPTLAEFHALDPSTVKVFYDSRGKRIVRAVIEFKYRPDGADVDVTYKRTITADRWAVKNQTDANGQIVKDASGAPVVVRELVKGRIVTEDGAFRQDVVNTLGICTVLHYKWGPRPGSPQLSTCATTGFEDVVAKSDSASTQVSAIATRHANPKLVSEGLELVDDDVTGDDGTVSAPSAGIAPTLALGAGEKVYYLQVELSGVTAFRDSTAGDMRMAREECSEFLMSESGANASGTALSMRAAAFTGKYGPKQRRFRAMLAMATSMALCLERLKPWSADADVFVCQGSTPLPLDRKAELDVIGQAVDMRVLKRSDAIAAAQALGIGPADADPVTYAEEISDEDRALDEQAGALLDKMNGAKAPPKPALVDTAAGEENGTAA